MGQKISTGQLKPRILDWIDSGGSNFTTSSTTYVAITGISTTYTSGATPEKLFVWFQGMASVSTVASGQVTLGVNGTPISGDLAEYTDENTSWDRFSHLYIIDVAANTTITLAGYAQTNTGTLNFHRSSPYLASMRGFAISQ